jgi:hypothetical protein
MRFAPTGSQRRGKLDYANLNRWRAATVCASRPSRYVSVINDNHLVSLMNFNEAKEN